MAYDADGNWYDEYPDYIGGGDGGDTPVSSGDDPVYVPYDNSGGQPGGTLPGTGVQMPEGTGVQMPEGAVGTDSSGTNWVNSLGQIVGPVVTGLIGTAISPWLQNLATGGKLTETQNMLLNAGRNVRGLSTPNLAALIPQLQRQVQQGTMTPAQAQAAVHAAAAQSEAAVQEASAMGGVNTDRQSLSAQRMALQRLAEVGQNGGMTEADRAQLAATMNQTNANAAQQRAAQLQQLQMQGNAGTGAELATRLAGGQQMANANAMAGANVASAAQARALQALQANLSGNAALNTQQFSQQAQKAQAQDAVNSFNAQARQATNLSNAGLRQATNLFDAQALQATNLANAGRVQDANALNFNTANTIAGTNTGIANRNLEMPLTVANQQWTNSLNQQKEAGTLDVGAGSSMAKLVDSTRTNALNAGGAAANATGGGGSSGGGGGSSGGGTNWGGIISGVGSAIGSIFSDERLKTDKQEMSDAEVDQLMGKLTAYKYRYKGAKSNPEQQGVMAQDMPGSSVIDTPAGKMVQGPEAMSKALAILANQHNRIKALEGK